MEKLYCQYCGEYLSEGCDCENEALKEIAESKKQFIEDYENDPLVQAGWTFQDNWEMSHFNQR